MDSNAFKDIPKWFSKLSVFFHLDFYKKNEWVYLKGQRILEKLWVALEGNIIDKEINRIETKRNEILYVNLLSQGNIGSIKYN